MTFTPVGTGQRKADLIAVDAAADSPQRVHLVGTGTAACATIGQCGYDFLTKRVTEGTDNFFVYKDADSGLNHGCQRGAISRCAIGGGPGWTRTSDQRIMSPLL